MSLFPLFLCIPGFFMSEITDTEPLKWSMEYTLSPRKKVRPRSIKPAKDEAVTETLEKSTGAIDLAWSIHGLWLNIATPPVIATR